MKTHFVTITTRLSEGRVREDFEVVSPVTKVLKFKTPREVLRVEAYGTNVKDIIVGFAGMAVELKPGQVVQFATEKYTDKVEVRRAS